MDKYDNETIKEIEKEYICYCCNTKNIKNIEEHKKSNKHIKNWFDFKTYFCLMSEFSEE